jgi:hypothetical protein
VRRDPKEIEKNKIKIVIMWSIKIAILLTCFVIFSESNVVFIPEVDDKVGDNSQKISAQEPEQKIEEIVKNFNENQIETSPEETITNNNKFRRTYIPFEITVLEAESMECTK